MHPSTHLHFTQRPSLAGLFVTAMRNSRPHKRSPDNALALRAIWQGFRIDPRHLAAFNAACGVTPQADISLLYPMTWAYPLILRMLSDRAAPMPLFHALNTKILMRQHSSMSIEDRFNLALAVTDVRRVDKGLELDIHTTARRMEDLAWESTMTFFYRGRFDGPAQPATRDSFTGLSGIGMQHQWMIPAKGGFRFGRLCGDTNPIHYGKLYAKAFGFERDFAQPLLVIGQALSRLPPLPSSSPTRLEARLKAPVYYERPLKMLVAETPQESRFDIYCKPNTRPSICACVG